MAATDQNSLSVSWTAPANTGPAISDYDLRYKLATASALTELAPDPGTATSATIGSLTASTAYHVQVRTYNGEQESDWSHTLNVSTSTSGNNPPTVANEIPDATATAGMRFSYTFPANAFND